MKPTFKPTIEIVAADGLTVLGGAKSTRNTYRIVLASGPNGDAWGPSGADAFRVAAYYGRLYEDVRGTVPDDAPLVRIYRGHAIGDWRGAARFLLGPALETLPADAYMREIKP